MTRWITSAKLFVLGAFLISALATTGYEIYYIWPVKRCDARGAWWDSQDHACLTPMPIWRITGRTALAGRTQVKTAPSADQRVAAGAQSTSSAPLSLANRAATNNKSDNRLR
jgi:hypothetical protein